MRWRLSWYALVGFGFVASFFFGVSMPKDWADAMIAIAPVEQWWNAHAAHPLLAAFFAGLAFGTVLIPELWIQINPHLFPLKPKPDIAAGDAFKLLFSRSKLARRLVKKGMLTRVVMYESHLTEPQKIAGRLRVELTDRIHNALADARIRAWGRLDGSRPEQEIVFTDWRDIEIDFSPRTLESSPSWVHAYKRGPDPGGRKVAYVGLRFNKAQLFREFPLRRFNFGRVSHVSFGKGFDEIPI
jgi:hypothetical protein